MKKIILGVVLLLPLILTGQAKWEFGLTGGGWMYMGDLAPSRLPVLKEVQPGAGALLRRHLGTNFALRGSFLTGSLSGSDLNIRDRDIRQVRLIGFDSKMMDASLVVEWEPWASRRYPGNFQFKKLISPYLFAGGAWYHNDVENDYSAMPADGLWGEVRKDQTTEFKREGFSIPFGGGVHFDLSRRSAFSFEVTMRRAANDYLDGVSFAGNPDGRDWYAFSGLTYNYRFTPRDRDRDLIPDAQDLCPAVPGALSAMGCPDADGDGLEDVEDMCPNAPGPRVANGCPDADGDELPDHLDDCPLYAGPEKTKGCPDADDDGIPDKDDECPQAAGVADYKGCPDTDGDGFPDNKDDCPEEAGVPEKQGCPYRDTDGDGIFDDFDECPDAAGPKALGGCPDTDTDGVADKNDRCPETSGTKELLGCPPMTEEHKKILVAARWGVEFETASATLKPNSANVLNKIAGLLKDYPVYHLQISGHTDNRGVATKNQALSEKRAKSCVDYLISKGVAAERLKSAGFGANKPIASNKTAKGRSRNRRVEFDLVVPGQ